MARTPAQTASLVKKAENAETKSEGMRMLLEAGHTVSEISAELDAPYGFVYGVASRWSAATGNPIPVEEREAKPKAAPKAKAAPAKAKAAPAAKASTATATKTTTRRTRTASRSSRRGK